MLTIYIPRATMRGMSKRHEDDHYTGPGSVRLKETILTYWQNRGFHGIRVERYRHPDFPALWFIRSNIGPNGYPPRKVGLWVL
jgi:hypothetical protein